MCGCRGPTGASTAGPTSYQYPFATSTSLPAGHSIGIGVDDLASNFLRCTAVVPKACVATSITFSLREASANGPYRATLNRNGVDTSLTVVIPDGTVAPFAAEAVGYVPLSKFDLICISTSWNGGALSQGACATLQVS